MARDDYFVIAYKILMYLYKCLKNGETVDIQNILIAETYGINERYFEYIITELFEDGYIKGVSFVNVIGRSKPYIKITSDIMIKPKGIMYLQDNSIFTRVRKILKETKEIIPGL